MTPDKIIQLAIEAGFQQVRFDGKMYASKYGHSVHVDAELTRFANLVADHTRNENPVKTPDIHYPAFAELRSGHLVVLPDNMVGANIVFVFDGETKDFKSVGKK